MHWAIVPFISSHHRFLWSDGSCNPVHLEGTRLEEPVSVASIYTSGTLKYHLSPYLMVQISFLLWSWLGGRGRSEWGISFVLCFVLDFSLRLGNKTVVLLFPISVWFTFPDARFLWSTAEVAGYRKGRFCIQELKGEEMTPNNWSCEWSEMAAKLCLMRQYTASLGGQPGPSSPLYLQFHRGGITPFT